VEVVIAAPAAVRTCFVEACAGVAASVAVGSLGLREQNMMMAQWVARLSHSTSAMDMRMSDLMKRVRNLGTGSHLKHYWT